MSTSGWARTLASWPSALRKDGQNTLADREAKTPTIHPRQEAANEHQRMVTNLGFVAVRPKERRAGCPCFP
jgi:hypothetical protein